MAKRFREDAIAEAEEPRRRMPGWLEWVLVFAIAIAASLLIRRYVVEFYKVPSASMLETIQEGDYLVGEKITYRSRTPEAGEVVTFDDPTGRGVTLIKRVIAVGGQTVDLRDGVVYVDGVAQEEDYTLGKPSYPLDTQAPGVTVEYPYTVPDGYLWVMGDNRTNSLDSRYFGAIPVSSVTSRAVWTYWPVSRWGAME